jgi:hypothetical protein
MTKILVIISGVSLFWITVSIIIATGIYRPDFFKIGAIILLILSAFSLTSVALGVLIKRWWEDKYEE